MQAEEAIQRLDKQTRHSGGPRAEAAAPWQPPPKKGGFWWFRVKTHRLAMLGGPKNLQRMMQKAMAARNVKHVTMVKIGSNISIPKKRQEESTRCLTHQPNYINTPLSWSHINVEKPYFLPCFLRRGLILDPLDLYLTHTQTIKNMIAARTLNAVLEREAELQADYATWCGSKPE
jgi:hypothetical protein